LRSDFHLILTELAATNGFSYDVLCGRTIERASFGFVWDQIDMPTPAKEVNLRGICAKCWQAFLDRPSEPDETPRYLSAIRSAKEDDRDIGEVA
jgi:hypothetical protein